MSAIIVVSLALGIGANTAVFSVAEALLLRPLPYPEPARLVNLWLRSPALGIQQDWVSPGEFIDIRTQTHSFSDLSISMGDSYNLTGRGQPVTLDGMLASSGLFRILGAKAFLGRLFGAQEDTPGSPLTAVITYGVWQRLFGGDKSIVGQSIALNTRQFTVVGVLSPEFDLSHEVMPAAGEIVRPEVFIPLPLAPDAVNRRDEESYNAIARLAPGVTLAQAQADVDAVAARIRQKDRRDRSFSIAVVPIVEQVVGNVRGIVLILLAAVGVVLAIACANVASLLLARGVAREREAAIRAAVGAGRGRLFRQLLLENLVLSLAGGTGGLVVAWGLIACFKALQPGDLPRVEQVGLNGHVLAFTFAVSILTGLVFGMAPALRISGVDPNNTLRTGGRGLRSGAGSDRLLSTLVVVELSLSLILLMGAGLLVRSFAVLVKVPPGFNPSHAITLRISLRGVRYRKREDVVRFFDRLRDQLAPLPGIVAQGSISALPLSGTGAWDKIEVEGYPPSADRPELQTDLRCVTPGYFRAMQIPLLEGRAFTDRDGTDAPGVVIVDRKMALRYWPHESPLGRRLRYGGSSSGWSTIVGVAGTVRQYGLDTDSRMAVYFPEPQVTNMRMFVVARTTGPPAAMLPAMVRAVHAADPDIPVYAIATMEERLAASLARQRFALTVLGSFAFAALLLAAVGIYGVVSYQVTQSTHDIGVRIALGALPRDIAGVVLRRGMSLAAAGMALGLVGAWGATRLMASMLYGVTPTDAVTFACATAFLGMVAMLASYVPAARAARLDPVKALRDE